MKYQLKNEVRGNEGIKKETVLRMHGSRKYEIKSHDSVLLKCGSSPAMDNVDIYVPYYKD